MRRKYLVRFFLLAAGFALTTTGILGWHELEFSLSAMWPVADAFSMHPVYLIVMGLALVPPTLWELFILENSRPND